MENVFDYLEYRNIHIKYLFDGFGSYMVFVYVKNDPNLPKYSSVVEQYITSGATIPLWTMEMVTCNMADGHCFKKISNILRLDAEKYYKTIDMRCKGVSKITDLVFDDFPFLLLMKNHKCVGCIANPEEIKKFLKMMGKAKITPSI